MHDGDAVLAIIDLMGTPWGIAIILAVGLFIILVGLPWLERPAPLRSRRRHH